MGRHYRDYSDFLAERFSCKMQKLTVDARFTCPNRDGTRGRGGCTYCNNASFSPAFTERFDPIETQLEKGKQFFAKKYPDMRYIAYFQSYTNTHDSDINRLMNLYTSALEVDGVDSVIIGTRPDCMPDTLLERLASLNTTRGRIILEYGAESSHDSTLEKVNRCHTWQDTVDTVNRTAAAGIDTGLHLILGLPGETEEMMLETVDRVSRLPVATVKFHQLQIIEGTVMGRQFREGTLDVELFDVEHYLELCCKIIDRLRRDIAIERFTSQSPESMLIAPKWGMKNHEFVNRLNNLLDKR